MCGKARAAATAVAMAELTRPKIDQTFAKRATEKQSCRIMLESKRAIGPDHEYCAPQNESGNVVMAIRWQRRRLVRNGPLEEA